VLIRDVFSYAVSATKRRKVRKGLAVLGVTIGIAAIISIVSLSSGFQALVNTQFEQGFSSDTLIVTTESISFVDTESDLQLYINDTEISIMLIMSINLQRCYNEHVLSKLATKSISLALLELITRSTRTYSKIPSLLNLGQFLIHQTTPL